jgi:hypothetical protein
MSEWRGWRRRQEQVTTLGSVAEMIRSGEPPVLHIGHGREEQAGQQGYKPSGLWLAGSLMPPVQASW